MTGVRFPNREAAGRQLAERLAMIQAANPLVLALPRGGVPVASELAKTLGGSLDVIVARRLWAPGQPELAIGAVAAGVRVLHEDLIAQLEISRHYVDCAAAEQALEAERTTRQYRGDRPPLTLAGRTVIVVDDGVASGATAAAALEAARRHDLQRLIFATPVASTAGVTFLRQRVDELYCVREYGADFGMVSKWYEDFFPPSEAEVLGLLARATAARDA